MDLTEKYPIKVVYGAGSRLYLLNWYTEGRRNYVLACKSVKQVEALWPSIVSQMVKYGYRDVKATDFFQVDTVNPFLEFHHEYANCEEQRTIAIFQNLVNFKINDYIDAYHKLPDNVYNCDNQVNWDYAKDMGSGDHGYCSNCFDGFMIKNRTPKELFYLIGPELMGESSSLPDRLQKITAPFADPSKELFMAISPGASEPVTFHLADNKYNPCVLFYCHMEPLEIPKAIKLEVETRLAQIEEAKSKKKKEWDDKCEASHVKSRKDLIDFFEMLKV